MGCRTSFVIFLISGFCATGAAPAPPQGPRLIRLAAQSPAKQVGVFHFRLLPDPLDRTPGNAATLWRLTGDAVRDIAKRPLTPKQESWLGARGTPLQRLPRQEVATFLAPYSGVFRLARQAACCEHCSWEIPSLTLQTIQESISNVAAQNYRTLINLLSIRYRLQLAEARYDEATETLQIGFALAHHLGESGIVTQDIVGMALATILLGLVEEWVQTPGSPNLYWALTALPRPLVNLRRSVEHEVNTFHRSFPSLRRLRRETLTERQADEFVKELLDNLSKAADDGGLFPVFRKDAEKLRKLGESIRAGESYAQARRHLLDLGRSAKEVDALPKAQAVLLWHIDHYDRVRDNILKALTVPSWQAISLWEAAFRESKAADDPLLSLIVPALDKTLRASLRQERQIAGLRCTEALRLYAADHEGKPPQKWSDITAVPLPVDPITGKGFDDFYEKTDGGRAFLEVPSPPGYPVFLGSRYELTPQ